MYYTIGQRRGLDIGGTEERMFVVGKDVKKNILYICIGEDNDYLISDSCIIDNVNYLDDRKITKCNAKFRYRQEDIPVELEYLDDGNILVKYKEGVKRVTPGQVCVLYDGDLCIGSGIIKEVRKNNKKLWFIVFLTRTCTSLQCPMHIISFIQMLRVHLHSMTATMRSMTKSSWKSCSLRLQGCVSSR